MRRWGLWIAATVVLLGGLGAGAYFAWRANREPDEPRIGGKTQEAWLEELRAADTAAAAQTVEQLVHQGEAALPVLLAARKDGDLRVHRRAVAGLVRLGGPAAPPLVEVLDRGGARVETALVRIGPPALPALERALASAERARPAARVLGGMGERARPAVASLVGLLQDRTANEDARAEAAVALGWIGPDPTDPGDGVVGALASVLSGPGKVRLASARALRQIGPAGRSAAPSLIRLVRDPDAPTARPPARPWARSAAPG
jgi:HEAT repeat protein